MVGDKRYNIRLVIDNQDTLGSGGGVCHVLKLAVDSTSRQPTVRHGHVTYSLHKLFTFSALA